MLNTELSTSDMLLDVPHTEEIIINPLTKEPLTLEEIEYLLTADI